MPTFYNFRENGLDYSFDDIFVPADLFREGNLWTWGDNFQSRLGDNTSTQKNTPVTTFGGGSNWKQVAGGYFTAAIKTDGTLWTWGDNFFANLGDNTTTTRSTPVTTFPGGTNWKQVACGRYYTAAIKTDGTLWTWGFNGYGQLGDNTTSNKSTPVTTFAGGTNWKQVSCGRDSTLAIKTDGTLWGWGRNGNAQLGINAFFPSQINTPVTTFSGGTNWKLVSGGMLHTAAIKTDGTLWTWGSGTKGQLGDNSTSNTRLFPATTFAGGTNWKQLGASGGNGYFTAAIKTDGTLWTWGYNAVGQLGTNDTTTRSTPVTTFAGGTNWKQVFAMWNHTAAIKTDGTLWTYGWNISGQLGDNTTSNKSTPVTTFAGGTNWKQVSCGLKHTIATTYNDPVI